MKINKFHIVGIPEEDKYKGKGSIFKAIMAEKFLILGKEMNIHTHEALKIPNRLNINRATPRWIIIKLLKVIC